MLKFSKSTNELIEEAYATHFDGIEKLDKIKH